MNRLTLAAIVLAILAAPLSLADDRIDSSDALSRLITTGDPADPVFANVPGNPEYRSGVGSIFIQFTSGAGFICTASALTDTYVLTASHCLLNGDDDTVGRLRFVLPEFNIIAEAKGYSVNPLFAAAEKVFGAFAPGDVAVIELVEPLPGYVETYDIYRDADGNGLGQETQHYGHGRSGVGEEGATGDANFFFGRTGKNQYDATFQIFFPELPGLFPTLIHDFDNGRAKNDATPWWYSPAFICPASIEKGKGKASDCNVARGLASQLRDNGFGDLEVGIAPGDSGGPGFIDDKIAGVHSFGFTYFPCEGLTGNVPDVTCGLDSSYGEMAGDAAVAAYADWIDDQIANGTCTMIPEPTDLDCGIESSSESSTEALSAEISETGRHLIENSVARHMRLKIK